MSFLIRTIDQTATGREIRRERAVEADSLTIGRATTNDIVLADLSVEQKHATVSHAHGGKLRMRAIDTRDFQYEGRHSTDTTFDPGEGGEFVFGTYRLLFAREGEGQAAITIQQDERIEGAKDAVRGFALASAMPGKRAMAWTGLGAILLAFLAIPIWSHLTRVDKSPGANDTNQVLMDASWSTGALSTAHHGLEDNCAACHVDAFVSVRDETCLTCHEEIADHAEKPRLAMGRQPFGAFEGFQWAVAETFGKEGAEACTTCHTEHEGEGRMEPTAQQFCADCHDTMDKRLTDTALGNAGDFGKRHPQLQAVVWTQPGQGETQRISLAGNPQHNDGLRFPHDMHMSPNGGVARMANSLPKYGDGLVCADCHVPDSDGRNFRDVEMEDSCEECHSLVYDRVGDTFRSLRHGKVEEMRADLAALDRAPRRPVTRGRARPGEFAQGRRYYQNFGRPQANYIGITRALSKDGVCGECHLPTVTNGQPDVVPVKFRKTFFINGKFDHDDHKQDECSTCHAAETSDAATDLLLPGIATCRECHQGADAVEAEVPSSCAMCHSYHVPSGRKPSDHPDFAPKEIARISRRGD